MMESVFLRRKRRVRYALKTRNKSGKPRLSVYKSNENIYAQIIDNNGHVVASASSVDKNVTLTRGGNIKAATVIGGMLAERAKQKGVQDVVFDRSGYLYHGRVKALADAARAGGLKF